MLAAHAFVGLILGLPLSLWCENSTVRTIDENEVLPATAVPEKSDENEVVPEKVSVEDLTLANTTLGYVRGKTVVAANGKKVDLYLGIPFAEPPLGQLRFKKPVRKTAWEGVLNAWNLPSSCMQLMDTYLGDFSGAAMWNANTPLSEDCLYLNIWVPRPRPVNAPVMVWIYGGGFFSGSITLDVYNGSILASEENVIVVAMQYRLGPFGFFYFGTEESPGNQGLFDQVLALQWIQENIENFGGHPKYVTLFGESAGAACVGLHLMSNVSSNLFMQAILQSGAPTADWVSVSKETALNRSADFAHRLDCPSEPATEAIECLRLVEAQTLVDDIPATGNVFDYYFNPVIDGDFLVKKPVDSLTHQSFKRTNIMLGTTANEGTAFLVYIFPEIFQLYQDISMKRTNFIESAFKLFPNMSITAMDALVFQYTDWVHPDDTLKLVESLEKMIGDKCITCDMNQLAGAYSAVGSGVFMYEFGHRSSNSPWPKWMGSQHTHEIEYVFGMPLDPARNFSEEEKNLTRTVMHYWANFARTGNPGLSPSGEFTQKFWPVFTTTGKEYLHISAEREEVRHGLRARQCAFWKQYLPKLTRQLQDSEYSAGLLSVAGDTFYGIVCRWKLDTKPKNICYAQSYIGNCFTRFGISKSLPPSHKYMNMEKSIRPLPVFRTAHDKTLTQDRDGNVDARSYCMNQPGNQAVSTSSDEVEPVFLDVDDDWKMEFEDWKRDHTLWKKEFDKYMIVLENARKLTLSKADMLL